MLSWQGTTFSKSFQGAIESKKTDVKPEIYVVLCCFFAFRDYLIYD